MTILTPAELPIEDYHNAAPAWWSKTALKDLATKGPAWVYGAHIAKTIKRKRPGGAKEGLALDCLLTEGEARFKQFWTIAPGGLDRRTKDGKKWVEDAGAREVLTAEEGEILYQCADAVRAHPIWARITECQSQLTVRRPYKSTGLQSRPDWLDLSGHTYIDLKKTRSLAGFPNDAKNLGYHLQAAVCDYCLAGEHEPIQDHFLVAVEWTHAPRVRAYRITEFQLQRAYNDLLGGMDKLVSHLESGVWQDNPPEYEDLPDARWEQETEE